MGNQLRKLFNRAPRPSPRHAASKANGVRAGATLPTSIIVHRLPTPWQDFSVSLVSATTPDLVSEWQRVTPAAWTYSPFDPATVPSDPAAAAAHEGLVAALNIKDAHRLAGELAVPVGFGAVGAVLIRVDSHTNYDRKTLGDTTPGKGAPLYVASLSLAGGAPGGGPALVPARSFVFQQQGARVFFADAAYLPDQTPEALKAYRRAELAVFQGFSDCEQGVQSSIQDPTQPPLDALQEWQRIYKYATYNDLGADKEGLDRPILGGSPEFPYPRRLYSGRLLDDAGNEFMTGNPYLPANEQFTAWRAQGFSGDAFKGVALSVLSVLKDFIQGGPGFKSFSEVGGWFTDAPEPSYEGSPAAKEIGDHILSNGGRWAEPRVLQAGDDVWRTDVEFGREVLAGQNPFVVQAVTSATELQAIGFSSATVPATLTGDVPLEALAAEGAADPARRRLFYLDYDTVISQYSDRVNGFKDNSKGRVLYGVHVLLHRTPADQLIPVAVRLQESPSKPARVITPLAGQGPWTLAKMFASSNDSALHQTVSHFLRTHAAMEPFIIATRRRLSILHPVAKLLHKHFVYTLQINSAARKSLINADGIIEKAFSPGRYSLELSSKYYAGWEFKKQALPEDLISRGMAYRDAAGKLQLVLGDFPYAADGLLLWDLMSSWITDYLHLYYKSDAAVTSDPELAAWWEEIRSEGHGDARPEGWPPLAGVESLAFIVTTISWIGSGHHSAVNFGQYDFSGLLMNRPSMMTRRYPEQGGADMARLQTGSEGELERELLKYLPPPISYATVLTTIQLLSAHAEDEAYIGDDDPWILDPAAVKRFAAFQAGLKDLEAEINRRNGDASLTNRNAADSTRLAYTLLAPTSGPGITMRGVPNSVSI